MGAARFAFPLLMLALPVLTLPAVAQPLTADQADAHRGEVATVEGLVSVDRRPSGEIYLDLKDDSQNVVFWGYISHWNASQFQDVDRLDGRQIQITGLISSFRHRPEIFLTDPGQIGFK
jgi:hypothetical protein